MRKVILGMSISLDGFVAGPNGELDWVTMDPEIDKELYHLMDRTDTALLGRNLFQGFASYWPNAESINPNLSDGEKYFAKWVDAAPKVVFSTTLENAEWNARVVKGDIAAEMARLKQQSGKDFILFGGARLAQTFVSLGLVDEYHLTVNPIILGEGLPLFKDSTTRQNLKLVEAKTYVKAVTMVLEKV